jgi:uncharacterized protein YciI
MAYFFFRVNPPRPSFAIDMSPAERQIMMDHIAYWTSLAEQRCAIAFGPVADPKGGWGMGLVDVPDLDAAQQLAANDPVMISQIGCMTEILPMQQLVLRPRS